MFLNVDFMGPFKENGYILYTLFIHMQAYLGGKKYMNGLFTVKYYDFVWIFIENRLKIQIPGYYS